MAREQEHSGSEELLAETSRGKNRLLGCGLWVLILFAVLSLLAWTGYSILVFLGLSAMIWWLSKRWGTRFTEILYPRLLADWFLSSSLNRKYLRGVFNTRWGVVLVFISIFPSLWLPAVLPDWLTPVLNLDEMRSYTGVIERLHRGGRKNRVDHLWLKETDGKITKFFFYPSDESYQYLEKIVRKDKIKLWSQLQWRAILYPRERRIQHIQHNEIVVINYNKDWAIKATSFGKKSGVFCMLWIVVSCLIVWFKFKNFGEEQ